MGLMLFNEIRPSLESRRGSSSECGWTTRIAVLFC